MHHRLICAGLLGCVILLGGCASLDAMNAQMAAQQHAADQATCEGYGYQPGTDKFADCMMATAHHRDVQQAIAQQQAAVQRQRQADQWEMDKARNAADTAQRRAEMQQTKNSGNGFTPPMPTLSTGKNCTSTTTSQQSGNAGSSTTTTTCH